MDFLRQLLSLALITSIMHSNFAFAGRHGSEGSGYASDGERGRGSQVQHTALPRPNSVPLALDRVGAVDGSHLAAFTLPTHNRVPDDLGAPPRDDTRDCHEGEKGEVREGSVDSHGELVSGALDEHLPPAVDLASTHSPLVPPAVSEGSSSSLLSSSSSSSDEGPPVGQSPPSSKGSPGTNRSGGTVSEQVESEERGERPPLRLVPVAPRLGAGVGVINDVEEEFDFVLVDGSARELEHIGNCFSPRNLLPTERLAAAAHGDDGAIGDLLHTFRPAFQAYMRLQTRMEGWAIILAAVVLTNELSKAPVDDVEATPLLTRLTFVGAANGQSTSWDDIVRYVDTSLQHIDWSEKVQSLSRLELPRLVTEVLGRHRKATRSMALTYEGARDGRPDCMDALRDRRGASDSSSGRYGEEDRKFVIQRVAQILGNGFRVLEGSPENHIISPTLIRAAAGDIDSLRQLEEFVDRDSQLEMESQEYIGLQRLTASILISLFDITEKTFKSAQKDNAFAQFKLDLLFAEVIHADPRIKAAQLKAASDLVEALQISARQPDPVELVASRRRSSSSSHPSETDHLLPVRAPPRLSAADQAKVATLPLPLQDKGAAKKVLKSLEYMQYLMGNKLTKKQWLAIAAFVVLGLGAAYGDIPTFNDALDFMFNKFNLEMSFDLRSTLIDALALGITSSLRLVPSMVVAAIKLFSPNIDGFADKIHSRPVAVQRVYKSVLSFFIACLNLTYLTSAAVVFIRNGQKKGQDVNSAIGQLIFASACYFPTFFTLTWAGLSFEGPRIPRPLSDPLEIDRQKSLENLTLIENTAHLLPSNLLRFLHSQLYQHTPSDDPQEEMAQTFLSMYRADSFADVMRTFAFADTEEFEPLSKRQKFAAQALAIASLVGGFIGFRKVWGFFLSGILPLSTSAGYWGGLLLALPTLIGLYPYFKQGIEEFFERFVGFNDGPHDHHTRPKQRAFGRYFGGFEGTFRVSTEVVLIWEAYEAFPDTAPYWIGPACFFVLLHWFLSMHEQCEPYAVHIPNFLDFLSEQCQCCGPCCCSHGKSDARILDEVMSRLRGLKGWYDRIPHCLLHAKHEMQAEFRRMEQQVMD